MNNWANFVTGYQSHQKESEDDSVWVLKGDVGMLSRTLKFRVHVTDWAGPRRVAFELEGLNEPMQGWGEFLMEPYQAPAAAGRAPTAPGAGAPTLAPRWSRFARVAEAMVRLLFRLLRGRPERAASADAGPGAGMAKLTFRLRIDPGGPMAPMVNAMMAPAMRPAAEDLANRIMAHLEARHGLR
jgi:carbon monoxide dehydrogenase subunit G